MPGIRRARSDSRAIDRSPDRQIRGWRWTGCLRFPPDTVIVGSYGLLAGAAGRLLPHSATASSFPRSMPAHSRSMSVLHPARGSRRPNENRRCRDFHQGTTRARSGRDRQRTGSDARLVGCLHAQRRPDGCRGQSATDTNSANTRRRSMSSVLRQRLRHNDGVFGPGIRLRRRRHDPRGHERRQIDADQRPHPGQGPCRRPTRSPRRCKPRSPRSTASSIAGSCSASIIRNT